MTANLGPQVGVDSLNNIELAAACRPRHALAAERGRYGLLSTHAITECVVRHCMRMNTRGGLNEQNA